MSSHPLHLAPRSTTGHHPDATARNLTCDLDENAPDAAPRTTAFGSLRLERLELLFWEATTIIVVHAILARRYLPSSDASYTALTCVHVV